ncbi:hypothetical protein V490_05308 [Pseudogymnoascus sp. VKM F-3557]|nr:hypothetical protein V490_05308 [Pseudogymnoascus sp. VKM F-3557]
MLEPISAVLPHRSRCHFTSTLLPLRRRDCPTSTCDSCLPAAILDSLTVDFDLTTSYGVAVALLYSGTALDIAKMPAAPAYRILLERLGSALEPAPNGRLTK